MTQSGGQGAGIQLQVGLDLAYFRNQLPLLSKEAAGHLLTFGVRLNRQDIVTQFRTLDRYVNNKKFNIEIKSNLKAEIKAAKELAQLLQSMPAGKSGTPGAIYNRTSGTEVRTAALNKLLRSPGAGGFDATQITKLAEAAIKAGIEGIDINASATKLRSTLRDAFQQAGDDSSRGLINALIDGRTAVGKAAAGLAEETLNTLRTSLQTQSPSKKTEKIGRDVGKGFEIGALSSMDKAFDALENKMRQRGKILDTVARGIFRMLGMDPAAMLQQAREQRTVPVRTPIAGLLPSFTSRGTREETIRQLREGGPSVAQGPGMLALSNEALGRRVSAILQEYFKVAEVQVRESFDPRELKRSLNVFSYIAQSLRDAESRTKQARVAESVDSLMQAIDNAVRIAQARVRVSRVQVSELGVRDQAALPAGRVAGFLPGRPSQSSVLELNNILAGAIREYFAAVARGIKPSIAQKGRPLLGPGSTAAGLLPPAGGTTVGVNRVRSSTGNFTGRGYEPPGGFPPDGRLGGRQWPATFIGAGSQMEKFKTGLDIAAASTRNFTASQIPLVGGIKNLAGEFGQAAKQVLLYGTAYKGLAFLTSLPGQILNAAKSQQQFNNGLKVATQDTGTFAKELLFVDNVQRAFGLNLETTRTGFTRLYASMAPTGFDSGSIEKLFTGISAATASLQLTPDKAERVIYAFGQMASKGQIMAEELKGQLGDVLPGALAIFSKAAGMSVKEFSKAMEDGEFTGNRFREVFAKVSDELMNRFGTGAQVAGRSLQGLINTVGGDFQRTLESFAPLANAAAQATLGPLTGMLREVSMAAQIAMGEQDRVRKQLEAAQADVSTLKLGGADAKEIKAAEQNVAALASKYEVLNEAAKDPAISQQVKNIEAFVVEIQKAATFTMNLAGIIGSVLNPLFTALGGNLTSVIGNLALLALGFNAAKLAALLMMGVVNTMNAIQGITAAGAAGTTALAGAFRLLGIQATGAQVATIGFGVAIKGLLISTGIGAVVVLLGSLAAAFLSVGNKAKEAADRAKRSIDSMADAARTGNVSLIEMELSVNKADRQDVENLIKSVEQLKGRKGAKGVELITLTPELKREAKRLGVEVAGEVSRGSVLGSLKNLRKPLQEAAAEGVQDLAAARKRAEALGMNKPDPSATVEDAEELKRTKTRADNLSQYNSLQDQLAKDFTQHQIDLLDIEHQHKVSLMNVFYDLQEARANSHQKAAIRFQKELYNITAEYQGAQLKAQSEVMKAAGSVAGGAPAGDVVALTGGALSQDPRTRGRSSGPHLHAQGAGMSEKQLRYLVDTYLSVGGKAASAYGQSRGSAGHGYNAIDFLTPQGTPVGLKSGASIRQYGPAGGRGGLMGEVVTPEGRFQLGHLQSLTPQGGGAPRKVTADQSRDVKAAQQTQLAVQREKVSLTLKEVEAVKKMEVAMENYVASIVPVAEQDLQNRLLTQRIQLTKDIASPAVLDAQIQYAEQEAKVNESVRLNNEAIAKLSQSKQANGQVSAVVAAQIDTLRQANDRLRSSLPTSQIQLLTEAIDKQVLSIIEQSKAKQREAEDNKQVDRLIMEGFTRQEAEAKVAADRLRGDYAKALEITNAAIQKLSAEQEIYNIKKAQNIALTKGETDEYNRLAVALEDAKKRKDALEGKGTEVEGAATALEKGATPQSPAEAITARISKLKEEIAELTNIGNIAIKTADGIGAAFAQAFQGLVTGSMTAKEALGTFFQSVGQMFIEMASEIIAKQLVMITLQLILKALGAVSGGGGGGNYSGAFKSAPGTSFGRALQMPKLAANGATFTNGMAKFASGGIVQGPTLFQFADGGMMKPGLMGEAGPEAIMPLSRGANGRLGVDASGIREVMDRRESRSMTTPMLSLSFESTTINGVEYVSREQLEQAMAQTRRQASREGAQRGMSMTLDKLQQSPATRSRVGIR